MRRLLNVTVLSILFAGCLAGCDEFWQKGDKIAQDANAVAGGAQAVLESPASYLIPPDLKLYSLLGIAIINGLVIGWQEVRNRTMKKTTKAIVKGIEQSNNPEKAVSEVKSNIADEMLKQGGERFYVKANKIVDKLRIS